MCLAILKTATKDGEVTGDARKALFRVISIT